MKPTTYDVPAEAFRRDRQPAPVSDHETIERRLARLEAWMRDEIFARTAMDEPEEEPVTAGEDELDRQYGIDRRWDAVAAKFLATDVGTFQAKPIGEQAAHVTRSEAALTVATNLGLAVRPDDPRLQPLAVTDALCRVICDCLGWNPMHLERNTGAWELANHIIAHLNANRGQS